jgi:glycosyltransferase involved in cell wall biosynthesis
MLRIGFDAKRAFLNPTGLGNYSRSVITSLASGFPENHYFLYTTKEVRDARTSPMTEHKNVTVRTPRYPLFKSIWRSRLVVNTLLQDEIDIYHGLSHEIPVGIQRTDIKTVVTIHDLIFLRYPQYYKSADRRIYDMKFRNACKHADRIIAISEQTKRDIIHFFGTAASKIDVVYQSCDAAFSVPLNTDLLQTARLRYALPDSFILNVGTIEDRKNLMQIVRALPHIPARHKLVVIGKETAYAMQVHKFIKEHKLEDRVIFLRDIPFTDLPAIYQLADVFVYPSEFEGFGIPILEALHSGIPVVAATGSCLEEAGGPDSLYIAPDAPEALAEAVNSILINPDLKAKMVAKGKQYAAGFTEHAHAENLMRIYKKVLAAE